MRSSLVGWILGAGMLAVFSMFPGAAAGQSGAVKGQVIPRLPNGKPDLSGVWDHSRVADMTLNGSDECTGGEHGCSQQGSGELPFTTLGLAEFKKEPKFDYGAHCLPWGYNRSWQTPYPIEIVQTEKRLAILFEQSNMFHVIPTDGRDHPKDLEPTWMGNSVGKWDGDTLVVDTIGFNDKTWLDTAGHPHSDALQMIERFQRTDTTHLNYEVVIEDPKMYTKPFKNVRTFLLRPDWEILEYSCEENNKEINEGYERETVTKK